MKHPHELLADPWNTLPDNGLYEKLNLEGVGPATSLDEIRRRFRELLALGAASRTAEAAYNILQVLPRRLCHDALMYSPEVADEMLELLRDLHDDAPRESPWNEQLTFAWDV